MERVENNKQKKKLRLFLEKKWLVVGEATNPVSGVTSCLWRKYDKSRIN